MPRIVKEDPTFGDLLDMALESQDEYTPKTGANLVGSDEMESPEDSLYLIGHFDSEAEAKKAQAARKKDHPDEVTHIFVPN